MTNVTLDAMAAESGYMDQLGGVTTSHIPELVATCGWDAGDDPPELRGWLSFDATVLPNNSVIRNATLVIDTVTSVGSPASWTTGFAAVDLDLDDLPTSWGNSKGGMSVENAIAPTSFSVNFDDLVEVLFNTLHTRIAFKLHGIVPEAGVYLQPLVSSAHLELTYSSGQAEVSLTSGLATEVSLDCALGSATSGDSGIVAEFEADSGAAVETDLGSGMGSTVELESGVDLEE